MEAIGDPLAEFGRFFAARALVPDSSLGADSAVQPGTASGASGFAALVAEGSGIVRPPHQNGFMEAIGERPEQYGGNVVVLGRAGAVASSGVLDLGGPAGASGFLSGSGPSAYDDDTRFGPGRPLRAVPAEATEADTASAASEAGPTQADSAAAMSVTGRELADSAAGEHADARSSSAVALTGPKQADFAQAKPAEADSSSAVAVTGPAPAVNESGPAASVTGRVPADSLRAGEPLSLAEIGRLVAQAAAAAPSILAGASYVEAANYAAGVEEISRTVEYLQVLSAGTVDRTRTQAIAAADTARASRSRTGTGTGTGKGWVTGWDNGVETLNETDTHWPAGSAPCNTGTMSITDGRNRVITSPADDGCANTAEFLRQRLRISKSEANR
ncbi:hypothetical protein SAMN05444745_102415, partial [Arthrobacter sp. OV608]